MTVIERLAHAAPVGVVLVDAVTGEVVTNGLEVRMTARAGGARTAVRTPSGVFAVHGLRHPRRWEVTGPDPVPAAPLTVGIEVWDRSGRYHWFTASAQVQDTGPGAGLVRVDCAGSPPRPVAARALTLFSRPTRPVPSGMAVVRARLAHAAGGGPAAYAALEVTPRPGAQPVVGIADERGEVLVSFAYPRPTGLVDSPPSGPKGPLSQARWEVTVAASLPAVTPTPGELPDLCAFSDRTPTRLTTATSPPRDLGPQILAYGRELVLRSSEDEPVLLVGA